MIENALKLLKKYFGYTSFKKGQEKVVESILNGCDTFAIMPTGAGKSICFQIPALILNGITIVISPLISLMKDQVDSLCSAGVPASFINSSLSYNEVLERIDGAKNNKYKLLYIAPERLEAAGFMELLKTLDVSLFAIDEAHCVSQWGHDFRPSYREVAGVIKELPSRPIVAAFTATATEEVKYDVIKLLELKEPKVFVTGFDRSNLFFNVIKGENKRDFLLNYINENKEKSGIIYAATRKEVDSIYELLKEKGFSIGKYHAGLKDDERVKYQESFIYDKTNIIVATNAFGMGIDKSNVRYVIHYNIPKNMEAYYQEAGRAGRDGEPSECIMLFSPQDVIIQKFLIEQTLLSPERKMNEYRRLQDVVDYCHTQRCQRKYILEYFGEQDVNENCGNCGVCCDDSELVDITIEAQKIFSCIARMKERYGSTLVAEVLKGSKNRKVSQLGFDTLSTYGIMNEYTVKEIRDIINMLTAEEYLRLTEGEYPVVKLTQKAALVLKSEEKVFQRVKKKKEVLQADDSLLDILKKLRRDIAERENVPPYIIFADSALREMCENLPTDEASMLQIKGVGEVKLKKYGGEFLNKIVQYMDDMGLTSKKEEATATVDAEENKKETPSHVVTLEMFKEGKSFEEIAAARELKVMTLQDHIIRCAREGRDVNLDDFIPSKYESQILDAVKKVGAEKLRPIKDLLPSDVDYLAIKAVLCKHKII